MTCQQDCSQFDLAMELLIENGFPSVPVYLHMYADEQVLIELAVKFGLPEKDFTSLFTTDETKEKTLSDYQQAHQLGVTGFPTVVLRDSRGYRALTVGYREYQCL